MTGLRAACNSFFSLKPATCALLPLSDLLPLVLKKLRETLGPRVTVEAASDASLLTIGTHAFRVKSLCEPEARASEKPSSRLEQDLLPSISLAEYIPEKTSQQLRQQGQFYADAMGNVWLLAEPQLTVLVSGQRSKQLHSVTGAAFRFQGLRLLFHLLAVPDLLHYADQDLVKRLKLPLTVTREVLADLAAQGLLDVRNGRRLVDCALLLAKWVEGYATTLRPKLPTRRYQWLEAVNKPAWYSLASKTQGSWSGTVAARHLLRQPAVPTAFTLYTSVPIPPVWMARFGLVPHQDGLLEVLHQFTVPTVVPRKDCAHPLLIYADLLIADATANRQLAQQILDRHLPHLLV